MILRPDGLGTEPVAVVVIGATGDLSQRLLLPALYRLQSEGAVSPSLAVVGMSRRPMTHDQFRTFARDGVAQSELVRYGGGAPWTRVIIEKPFGHDEASARRLDALIDRVIGEQSCFRIDHYLGKETVQNMLVFRFANTVFEPVWDRRYVDHVQISFVEDIG